MTDKNILSHHKLQFLCGLIPGLLLSVGIISFFWSNIFPTPASLMTLYISATVFFSIAATVVRLRLKLNFAAGALYVVSFLWFFSYAGQRITDFDFFTDYRYKVAYQEKKDAFKPEVALAALHEGDGALSNGNFREAKLKYHTALHFDTSNAEIYFALGNVYMRSGSSDTALIYFHEGLKRRFENPMVHNFVGVLSANSENYDTAVRAFQTAIMQDTSFQMPKDNLASVLRKKRFTTRQLKPE
jgi:tetratricopeptide (TPR) repeat protein